MTKSLYLAILGTIAICIVVVYSFIDRGESMRYDVWSKITSAGVPPTTTDWLSMAIVLLIPILVVLGYERCKNDP